MASKSVLLLCHWDGNIYDGPEGEGVCYSLKPRKGIEVQSEITFNELINQINIATNQNNIATAPKTSINVICRYPTGFGERKRYTTLPINDDADIKIMFEMLDRHKDLTSIELYLEVKTQHCNKKARSTQKKQKDVSTPREISKERTDEFSPTFQMTSLNEEERVLDPFPHEDFYASLDQLKHYIPRENHGDFVDLVWAQIKNHQWWSVDIFEQADESEPAFGHKKECRLLAYFGDKAFASSVSQLLNAYRSGNTTSSKTFLNAVDCALNAMSRQVHFGLTCTCVSGAIWDKLRPKSVDNSEVHCNSISISNFRSFKPDIKYDALVKQFPFSQVVKETTKSTNLNLFDRDKLREYVVLLSTFQFTHSDNIDTTIAEAQLSDFCHNWCRDLVEEDSALI